VLACTGEVMHFLCNPHDQHRRVRIGDGGWTTLYRVTALSEY
jgi:hypothetical protein